MVSTSCALINFSIPWLLVFHVCISSHEAMFGWYFVGGNQFSFSSFCFLHANGTQFVVKCDYCLHPQVPNCLGCQSLHAWNYDAIFYTLVEWLWCYRSYTEVNNFCSKNKTVILVYILQLADISTKIYLVKNYLLKIKTFKIQKVNCLVVFLLTSFN